MKTWVVRFASLYAFNVAVLLLIGIAPQVRVGLAALWAGVVLTAATVWLKPFISRLFTGSAAKTAAQRTSAGEKFVQYGIVFAVELIVWVVTVFFSGIQVRGLFWGWIIPPVLLLVAWIVYDRIDDRFEAKAAELYERAQNGLRGGGSGAAAPLAPETASAREELRDGLTAEQRRLLDELDKP